MKAWLLLVAAFLLWPGFSSQNACEEPDEIDFGEIVSAEKAKYLENDRVQYRCNPGYVLEGPEWIQCNGEEWTPHPPKCLAPCSITRQQLTTKNLFVFGNQRKARLIQSDHSLQFQCNEGYVLVVPSVRKCVDGYMDFPLCISERGKNCSGPPRTENGDITTLSEKQYRSGSSVEFRCQKYYAMEGQNRSFCNNGTWTKVPNCLDPCMIPRTELESQKIEVKDEIDAPENIFVQHGHSIELTCRTGYVLAANSSQSAFVIHCDGTPPVIPKCKEITCNSPRISNGTFRPQRTIYHDGDLIRIQCDSGFTFDPDNGEKVVECTKNGWSPPPKCIRISCGSPGDSDFASFELTQGEDFTFGARVVYTCNEGYKMLSQHNYRDCRANGWTNEVPHCEINKCPPIAPAGNVRIIQGAKSQMNEDFLSGDLVIFGCIGKLKIKGANKITCTADGTWSAPVPECIEITCQADYIENGNVLSPKIIYKEGERIRFSCNEGYSYVDRPDALCTETGWGTKLQCEEIKCFLPEVMNGYFQYRRDHYMYNEEIETICNEGFVFGGPGKVSKCTATGWDPPTVCKRKGCDYIRIENGQMADHFERYKPFPIWEGQSIHFYCYEGFLPKNKQTWQTAKCISSRYDPEPKCFKKCNPTQRFYHGHIISNYWNTYIEGDNVTFVCDMGYSPANQQSSITCTKKGWSPAPRCIRPVVEPTCTTVSLSHGNFGSQQQSFQINAKAKYICHDGYTTSKGETEAETQCLKEGWSPEPECIKTCLKPPERDFIFNKTKSVFFPGDKLHYECKEGFEITTIDDTIACTEKGWEPTPSCVSIVCITPFLENGTIEPREDIFQHKMVVHFKCNEEFTRVGSESAQCYHFGWSPQPPICKENVKPCPAMPIISHGIVTGVPKAIFQHGDRLEVQCEISFALYGSKIIECVDGQWAPLPSCKEEVKTCRRPPTIKNGYFLNVKSSIYRHGDTVEYRCQQRHSIIGTNPAKCLHGQWEVPSCLVNPRSCTRPQYAVFQPTVQTSKQFKINQVAKYRCGSNLHQTKCVNGLWLPEPRCKGTCPPPPQLPNAINIAEMRIYKSGEEVSFKCEEHFLLRGPQKIKCENGTWQTPPRCLDLRCKSPPEIDNGIIDIGNRTMFFPGEIVEYHCSSGFEISQLNSVRCENSKWSELPVCKEQSCDTAPVIPNASLEQEDSEQYDSGKIINYTCNHGFETKESTKITCRRGQWVGSFTCKDATCPTPPIVENAEIIEDTMKKYLNGEKINYQCNDGFDIHGSAAVTCRKNNWSRLPRCVDVRCSSPHRIQNGQIIGEIKAKYLPREKVQYRCYPGYALLGSPFITCSKNRWTETPRCTDIGGKCGRPPRVENGDIVDSPKPIYLHSESVTYQCQHLYTMQGSPRVTCQNGHWSQTPTCRVACTASQEDMREHNIRLKWENEDKIYSEDGNVVEFVCLRNYILHPDTRSLRVNCVDGKFNYPRCIPVCIFSEKYFNSPILTFLSLVYIYIPIYLYLCIKKNHLKYFKDLGLAAKFVDVMFSKVTWSSAFLLNQNTS